MADVILDRSGSELRMLRDVVIRAHGMATGRYIQSDQEMRRRIGVLLDAAIDASPAMTGLLGRGGPEAHRDIIGGSGDLGDSAVAAAKAQIVGWLRFQEREWRDTSANLGSSVAGNVAAHYAQALHNAIESIESDAPERWAAEREGQGDG